MKILHAVFVALMIVLGSGCTEVQTAEKKLDQIILLDIQGLNGGRDLWISTDSKASVCRLVVSSGKGLQETRYEFMVSEKQLSSLCELITKHNFFSIRIKDRYGIPDEARPGVFVKSGGTTYAVGKWAGDKHKDFDPIYKLLLQIAESGGKSGKETHRGSFDWNWKPDGFPENKSIVDMTKPNIKEK